MKELLSALGSGCMSILQNIRFPIEIKPMIVIYRIIDSHQH